MPKGYQRAVPSCVMEALPSNMESVLVLSPGLLPLRLEPGQLSSDHPVSQGKKPWLNSPSRTPSRPGHASQPTLSPPLFAHLYRPLLGKVRNEVPCTAATLPHGRRQRTGKCFLVEEPLRTKNLILPNPGIESSPSPFQTIEGIRLLPAHSPVDGRSQSFEICKISRLCKEEVTIIMSDFFSIHPTSFECQRCIYIIFTK